MRQVLGPGALGKPRWMGWRGRWEWGSGWGTHVNPWLIHVNVWQNPLQYCKVISFQLIKINGKKKEYWSGFSCPLRGDLLDPGIKPASLMSPALARGYFIPRATWEAPQFFTTCWLPSLAPYFEVSLQSCSLYGPSFPQSEGFKNRKNVYVWESTQNWQHSLL